MDHLLKKANQLSGGAKLFLGLLLLFAFCIGPTLIYCGIASIRESMIKASALSNVNQIRSYIASWPSVTGRLDQIDLRQVTLHGRYSGPNFCSSTVKYHYVVGDKNYSGDCLRRIDIHDDRDMYAGYNQPGIHTEEHSGDLEDAKKKLAALLPPDTPVHETMLGKEDRLYSYFPNRPVAVYYDPKAPASSMLDNRLGQIGWWQYCGDRLLLGMFVTLMGTLLSYPYAILIGTAVKRARDNNTIPRN